VQFALSKGDSCSLQYGDNGIRFVEGRMYLESLHVHPSKNDLETKDLTTYQGTEHGEAVVILKYG